MTASPRPKVLLLNPPVHDFAAYDFWLKPYGLLTVGGWLRGACAVKLFDFMDRFSPYLPKLLPAPKSDAWGRGAFYAREIPKPAPLAFVPRRYWRFGVPQNAFEKFLQEKGPFDFVLITAVMTYWYPGVKEVTESLRHFCPAVQIVLGGPYAQLCPSHAAGLDADLVLNSADLNRLWDFMDIKPDLEQLPFWEGDAGGLTSGVLKLTDGCPFSCTYCASKQISGAFAPRPLVRTMAELDLLKTLGVQNIAFYDDALLADSEKVLQPFLEQVLKSGLKVNFHAPNAVHARFVSRPVADLMLRSGFKKIYLGLESRSETWQKETGGKMCCSDLEQAVENLRAAGADLGRDVCAYLILGHPKGDLQELENSMQYAHKLGLRLMLAEFSPIPGTPDGELCRAWVDLDEPLLHNKTAFAVKLLGDKKVQEIKEFCRELNRTVGKE